MDTQEIVGGVSPLKARGGSRRRGYAGKAGRKNTATKRGRRGFSKAGPKGVNRHGYGALTRFKPPTAKADKGPLAPATTTKTGGSPNPNPSSTVYNYGDNIDNSVDNSITDNRQDNSTINVDNKETIHNNQQITNKTNTEVKTNVDQTNKNKTKQSIKSKEKYTYRQSWDDNAKNVQGKYKNFEEYKKAAIAWNNSPAGKIYWANKNKTNQSNESNVNVDASTNNTNNMTSNNSTGGVRINKGKGILNEPITGSPLNYKQCGSSCGCRRCKNKGNFEMKSHAWNMIQKQKKGRGGTSPGKFIGGKLSEQDSSQNFLKQGNFKG